MAKHRLYELCFEKSVEHAQKEQPEFGAVLRQLRETHRKLFDDFPKVLRDMRPKYLAALTEMHSEVVRTEEESRLLLEAAEVLEREVAEHAAEKERMSKIMGASGTLDSTIGGELNEDRALASAVEDSTGRRNFASSLRSELYGTEVNDGDGTRTSGRDMRRFRSPGIENYTPTPGGGAFARAASSLSSQKKQAMAKPRQLSIKQLLELIHA